MSEPITKSDLAKALSDLGTRLKTRIDSQSEELRESLRGLNTQLVAGQGAQNERLDEMDAKLAAIMEMLTMRRELHALVRELKAQGITLDESRIFAGRPSEQSTGRS